MCRIKFLFASFAISFFLLSSCTSIKNTNPLVEINETNVLINSEIDILELIDKFRLVRLETNSNCLIGTIRDIQFDENNIYIQNFVAGENELLVFDNTGKFVRKIGQKGQGIHEYLSMVTFCVNNYENYVLIFDTYKKCVHKYDIQGKYIKALPAKAECGILLKTRFVSQNRMVCVNGINSLTNTLIYECDVDFGNQKIISSTALTDRGLNEYAKNPITTDGQYFLKPLSNSVYQFDNEEAVPVFQVELNIKKYNPEKEIENGGDYGKYFLKSIQNGFFPLNGIWDIKKYLLIQQNGYFTIFNKDSKRGIGAMCSLSKGSRELLPFAPCSVIGSFNDNFVTLLSNNILLKIKDYYTVNKIAPNNRINKLLNETGSEENPILGFYHFK